MSRIFAYIMDMLPWVLACLPIVVIVRLLILHRAKRMGRSISIHHEVGLVLFILFLVALASQTVIPPLAFGSSAPLLSLGSNAERLNLIPFTVVADTLRELRGGNANYLLINFFGNIGIFMPVGFFLLLLYNMRTGKACLIALGISLCIEVCQIPQMRGSDIDDLWLNTLGAFLGCVLYLLLDRFFGGFFARFKAPDINQTAQIEPDSH